jgi:hypothetical protein
MDRDEGPSGADDGIIGRASTVGQALPIGLDDPVVAARAVRRALADARRRGIDVVGMVVAAPPPLTLDAAQRFARRALGPHGDAVRLDLVAAETGDAARLAQLAAEAARSSLDSDGLWVAVGIGPDETTVALCVERGRGDRETR